MKNEIVKAKHVKPINPKLYKFYLQILTDASVKIAVLEICCEKNTREPVIGTSKNMCTVSIYCWYIKKMPLKDFSHKYLKKIIDQNILSRLAEGWVKKEKIVTKIFFR